MPPDEVIFHSLDAVVSVGHLGLQLGDLRFQTSSPQPHGVRLCLSLLQRFHDLVHGLREGADRCLKPDSAGRKCVVESGGHGTQTLETQRKAAR